MAQLLLVEDDVLLGEGVKSALEQDGHAVALTHSVAQAQKLWQAVRFDLCLLDIRLPDGSGLDLCAEFRQTRDTPIIFLTANDADEDVVRGFRMGGDDYVTKPFAPEVLRQRVLAVLRRTRGAAQIVRDQELEIDLDRQTVRRQGETIRLTATEWKLLERLVRSRGRVLTRTMLLEQIWDVEGSFVDENTLSVHIRRLRQKLEPDPRNPRYIVTVFGLGYTFGEMLCLTKGPMVRINSLAAMCRSDVGIVMQSEISRYPLGMVLYINKPKVLTPLGLDITQFADCKYSDECNVSFYGIPLLEVNTQFPDDYRSKDEIIEEIALSQK